jgi:very-short-patch-repair endonuclease
VHVAESPDRRVAQLAAVQHGIVSRAQLLDAGMSSGAIAHRLAHGRLHRIHRGVYPLGHRIAPPWARETAAVLAYGALAALSHRTAGKLWGLLSEDDEHVHVTVVGEGKGRPGIRIHRARSLESRDLARRHGLPLTSPVRTLLDLSGALSRRELERAVEEAERTGLVRSAQLAALLARSPGRRGTGAFRTLLERTTAQTLTRSEAEERLLALVRAARLPHPELNVHIAGHEVDFLSRDAGLVVEVDGFAFHSTRSAFERDRLRDAELLGAGLAVLRVTWGQIVSEPEPLLVRLAQALPRPRQRLSSAQWQ